MNNPITYQSKIIAVIGLVVTVNLFSLTGLHAEVLSLHDAMRQALENNQNIEVIGYEADARLEEQYSVRGRFLPVIKTSANILYWDAESKSEMNLSGITDILMDMAPLLPQSSQDSLANLQNNPVSIQIHDQLTYKASLTIAQPLIQLYGIYFNYDAAGKMAKAAAYDLEATKLQLELDVAKTYYGLLAAMRMKNTLAVSLKQIDAYDAQVNAFLDAGRIERNALMKVEVQRADLQKALFAAEKAIELSKSRLNVLMGRPLETKFEPQVIRLGKQRNHSSSESVSLTSYVDHAITKRPDILSVREMASAGQARRQAAISAMLPELNAVFNYDYNGGMGSMQPENQYFVGLTLSWNIWEWGATYYQQKAAETRMKQAASRLSGLTEQAKLEVKSKKLDLDEALQGYAVALLQRQQATENLRVEMARYKAEQTTTADLLQAQAIDVKSANDLILAEMKALESHQELLVASGYDLLKDFRE